MIEALEPVMITPFAGEHVEFWPIHKSVGEGVTFAGDQTFLKLARSSGEILFLGEVNRDQRLELLINLPLGTRSLRYEIFSGSPLDDTLFGEIAL